MGTREVSKQKPIDDITSIGLLNGKFDRFEKRIAQGHCRGILASMAALTVLEAMDTGCGNYPLAGQSRALDKSVCVAIEILKHGFDAVWFLLW